MAKGIDQLPNVIKDSSGALNAFSKALVNDVLTSVQDSAQGSGLSTKRMPNYLILTEERMAKQGVVDLKQSFARSSKRKFDKKGNWYMIVPIRVKRRAISKRAYNELKNTPLASVGPFTTTATQYLYDKSPQYSPSVPILNYQPKSHNVSIVKQKWGDGFRRNYYAFRTVSAKSPANSWITNRQEVNDDNFSPTMIKNIERLVKYRMKNLN